MQNVVVTGATSQIGDFLLPMLAQQGFRVEAWSRNAVARLDERKIAWHAVDIQSALPQRPGNQPFALIHLAPLWLLPDLVQDLAASGLNRVIAFGSTSRFTKAESGSVHERELAARLERSELMLAMICERYNVKWTLFRPTLIYGCGRDLNVSAIANFIGKYRVFPLVGGGRGLRQPVHAEDLAQACVLALDNAATYGNAYNLSGGETLCYRSMVERIFIRLQQRPRFIPIPLPLFKYALAAVSVIPKYRHVSSEMAVRMNQDLCFDHGAAERDFGYFPRPFQP